MKTTFFVREYWRRRLMPILLGLVWSALFAASVVVPFRFFWSVCFPLVFPRGLELLSHLLLHIHVYRCSMEGGRGVVPFRGCGCRWSPFLAFLSCVSYVSFIFFGRKVFVS